MQNNLYFMTAIPTNGETYVNEYSTAEAMGVFGERAFREMVEGGQAVTTVFGGFTVCMNAISADALAFAMNGN